MSEFGEVEVQQKGTGAMWRGGCSKKGVLDQSSVSQIRSKK